VVFVACVPPFATESFVEFWPFFRIQNIVFYFTSNTYVTKEVFEPKNLLHTYSGGIHHVDDTPPPQQVAAVRNVQQATS
jgi:hypothetical protein